MQSIVMLSPAERVAGRRHSLWRTVWSRWVATGPELPTQARRASDRAAADPVSPCFQDAALWS